MFGGSYVGATQFLAAIAHPPHLSGIAPNVTASNYHDGWTYQGGAFEQWFNQSWATGLSEDTFMRASTKVSDPLAWKNTLPLADYPVRAMPEAKSLAAYYTDWLAHPNYDDYWKAVSIEEHYSQIEVPVLNLAAWYDIFLGGSLRNYELLKTKAGSEAARKGQRLLIYPGGHAGSWELRKIGDVDFGERAPIDGDGLTLDWYDAILKGMNNAFSAAKPVRIFVMGRNEWRGEEDWPLARAKSTKYFLESKGNANSSSGDGMLRTEAPRSRTTGTRDTESRKGRSRKTGARTNVSGTGGSGTGGSGAGEAKDTFEYDPASPVPTIGGPLCCRGDLLKPGPFDQKEAELRKDVLVYTTAALERDLEVTGPVTA